MLIRIPLTSRVPFARILGDKRNFTINFDINRDPTRKLITHSSQRLGLVIGTKR